MRTIQGVFFVTFLLVLTSCSSGKKQEPIITQENFLTLADVTGRTNLKEDSPDVRVINVKAKALIKKNNIRAAKQKAVDNAAKIAVEEMIRELMPAELYNRRYEEIERYFSKNIHKYIVEYRIGKERKIYLGRFYGIAASFKISRQKVLVALQKDLRIIDASQSSLVTVITSKKGLDLASIGITFSDVENALMNQIQTHLNQRGLKAIDFRNAVASMQSDPKMKQAFSKISKTQFMAMIAGSSAEDALLDEQVEKSEAFYATGLSILKQMAKVVVEINILSVSKTGNSMVLNMNITAKNISVASGGAFANTIIQTARRAGSESDDSAMVTALIKDAYKDMDREFIPQIIKEMSTIDVGGKKLIQYELVMKGFNSKEFRKIRSAIEKAQNDHLRYLDYDNSLKRANPSINRVFVRYSGKSSKLGDTVMEILDSRGISADEPTVAPGLRDLVFEKLIEDE